MTATATRQGRKSYQFITHETLAEANAYTGIIQSFSLVLDTTGKPFQIRVHDGVTPGGFAAGLIDGIAAAAGYTPVVAPPPAVVTVAAGVPFTVTHDLGRMPIVQAPDAPTQPSINHIDMDNVELTFATAGTYTIIMV